MGHLPHLSPEKVRNMTNIQEAAAADLSGCSSIAEMSRREEEFDPDRYAIALAHNIRNDGVSLDVQRERLAALAQVGGGLAASRASAEELGRHLLILNALFTRLALMAANAAGHPGKHSAEAADRLTSSAIKAQRAAVSVLGAMKALRDGAQEVQALPTTHPDNGNHPPQQTGTTP